MSTYLVMEKLISKQVKFWEAQKAKVNKIDEVETHKPYITIEREYGCMGNELGKKIIEILNNEYNSDPVWVTYDKEVLNKVMADMDISYTLAKTMTDDAKQQLANVLNTSFSSFPAQVAVYRKLAETIRLLAVNGNVVVVGRAGNVITRGLLGGYNVRIVAPMSYKISNVVQKQKIDKKTAEKLVIDNTERRVNYIREFVNFDITDPHNYHLVINASKFTMEEMARMIIDGLRIKGLLSS